MNGKFFIFLFLISLLFSGIYFSSNNVSKTYFATISSPDPPPSPPNNPTPPPPTPPDTHQS
jgi:hypothetical protein